MKWKKKKNLIEKKDMSMLDPNGVMAIIGKITIKEERYNTAKFSIEYLKKAIAIAETMGQETLDFAVAKDYPIIIGKYDKEKKEIAGIIIAPRSDEE
jgi:hypothetical protein